jgi:mono/diheme cytochrome c family protein
VKLNLFLACALGFSVAAGFFVRSQPSRPNVEFLPEMVRVASYGAYSANPNFADGKTLQLPPPNTIPRGFRAADAADYEASEAGAIRAGEELRNPYAFEDLAAYTRGAFVFRTWCLPCHGPAGRGDGQVAMRGFPAPPPFTNANSLAMKDGRMFHVLTYGQKNMPSYAAQIAEDDRWKAILYVRSLQRTAQPAQPPPVTGTAPGAAGQETRQ